jgi:type I restriction enzyme S subunit
MEEQKNMPQLRFPEFEGEWIKRKLGNIASVTAGGTPSTLISDYWDGTIRWMNSGELNLKRVYEVENRITEQGLKNSSTKLIPKYSVLIGLAGQGKTRGTVAMNMVELCTNQSIASVYPDENLFNSDFLYHNLDNRYDELRSLSTGEGGRGGLNLQIIKALVLNLPNLPEQQKIASFFTAIDQKISQLKKKKTLLEQYKKGVMQKIFSQEIRFKDDNGQEFPKWEKKKLGEVSTINPPTNKLPDKFIYIDLESVNNGELTKEVIVFKNDAPSRAQRVLEKDDILFQMVRPYQKNNLYFERDGDYVASTGYAQIKTKQSSRYIYQYLHLQKFVDEVIERCTGTSYPAINSKDLAKICICYPTLPEQTKIANFLSAIDDKINHTQKQIEKAETWKKGLLQQMFV